MADVIKQIRHGEERGRSLCSLSYASHKQPRSSKVKTQIAFMLCSFTTISKSIQLKPKPKINNFR